MSHPGGPVAHNAKNLDGVARLVIFCGRVKECLPCDDLDVVLRIFVSGGTRKGKIYLTCIAFVKTKPAGPTPSANLSTLAESDIVSP